MQPYEVIAALEATSSKTQKEGIVRRAYEQGCMEFFLGAQYAYDAMVTFGVGDKHLPLYADVTASPSAMGWDDFKVLADMLRTRHLTGGDAWKGAEVVAEACTIEQWDGWYRRVLLKDFKAGVSESTINKVLKGIVKDGDPRAEGLMVPKFSCQLAHPGEKHPAKLKGWKYVDVKLDGVRILAICDKDQGTVTIHTRNGKVNTNFPEIEALLRDQLLPQLTESAVIDGEMVSTSFNELMTQVNRRTDVDTADAKLAVFDFIPLSDFRAGTCIATQETRDALAAQACSYIDDDRVYHIAKRKINLSTPEGKAEFEAFNREAIAAGYEGIMVKDIDAPYVTKRSHAWLKLKPTITVDLTVVGIEPGERGTKYEHCTGKILCEGTDDASGHFIKVAVGSGLTDEQRESFWANQSDVIGRTVEVLADHVSANEQGGHSLRFPRFVRFRDDK